MASTAEAFQLALNLHQAGRLREAEEVYRRILAADPHHADGLHLLGVVTSQLGDHEAGAAFIRRAVEVRSRWPAALTNLANALLALGTTDDAVLCCRQAIAIDPSYANAHGILGLAFKRQERFAEAADSYRRAMQLAPGIADARNDLGTVLLAQGHLDEAEICLRQSLEMSPLSAVAHNNLGSVFWARGQAEAARPHYERAVELKPDFPEAHWNLSQALLLLGDFRHGWEEYEWRLRRPNVPRPSFPQPLWQGEPLHGRTILLHAEQGLGDTLQFVRYARLVEQAGGKAVVACAKALLPILARCPFVERVVDGKSPPAGFDVWSPLLSLPRIFATEFKAIPAEVPYLFAAPERVGHWRERLQAIGGFKIGIAWQGNPRYPADKARSIPLRHFAPLAALPGVRLISLQKEFGRANLTEAGLGFTATDFGDELDAGAGPFMDTAAILQQVDLLVTSDTAAAHLAGALGRPAWVALPHFPDWRWLLDRDDSPWYPTMRLFRQKSPGDWQEVFTRIARAVEEIRQLGSS